MNPQPITLDPRHLQTLIREAREDMVRVRLRLQTLESLLPRVEVVKNVGGWRVPLSKDRR